MLRFLICLPLAYLMGSLCSAIIVCKILKLPDPREQGSGNPGATNVLRFGGKKAALTVLLADLMKGFLPVLLGHILNLHGFMLGLVALAAILGHLFPIFFGFKGGKGVATGGGALLGLSPLLGLSCIALWVGVIAATRFVSLGSIVACGAAPFLSLWLTPHVSFLGLVLIAVAIIGRHHQNIQRLRAGSENKLIL